jgi:hypothetical protein
MQVRRLRPDSNLLRGNIRYPVKHLNSALVKIRKWSPKLSQANRRVKVRLKSIRVSGASA